MESRPISLANPRLAIISEVNSQHTNSMEEKKIHPAIGYFHQLHRSDPSASLSNFLSDFNQPRSIDAKNFAEGVKKFTQLANSSPWVNSDEQLEADRKKLYGNIYLGLHYSNDLARLWNTHADSESIQAGKLLKISPPGWTTAISDERIILIYRGQRPAQALDQLVKGPSVIDCSMFSQLSLWFGIRYLLGDERFNQFFGRAPFFITQSVYQRINDSTKPYLGNPLYSFLTTKEQTISPCVSLKHVANTSLYLFKHPGGYYNGENCVLIDKQYYVFDPHLQNTHGLTESKVLSLLLRAFNEERTEFDNDRLSLYALNPEEIHPKLAFTYGELIQIANKVQDKKLTEEEFLNLEKNSSPELAFDLDKFTLWLQLMENSLKPESSEYIPQLIDYSVLPVELLNAIPFENRVSMEFSTFKQETAQQKELIAISKQFCQSVMLNEAKLVILTGKAGVGKTAAAVCAAKELAAHKKKIVWVSEIMVQSWASQAKSIEELNKCAIKINKLLATNPDVIFLDDDNLTGFSGQLLLEKIYSWYVRHPGKGLFITSNELVCFNQCYGYKLDGRYHYPPFSDYYSPQYVNWQCKTDLAGNSLRAKRDGQSIGAIVSSSSWKKNESQLNHVELIPGFLDSELWVIRKSLTDTGLLGSAYDQLSSLQKKWLSVDQVSGRTYSCSGKRQYVRPHLNAYPSHFEKTNCKTIALEIRAEIKRASKEELSFSLMYQLIRVINYAHDQGGRRIILINQTSFTKEELLSEIKKELPRSERERTWSRLCLLLCETEETIFNYDQFNDGIKNNFILERNAADKGRQPNFFGESINLPKKFNSPVQSPSSRINKDSIDELSVLKRSNQRLFSSRRSQARNFHGIPAGIVQHQVLRKRQEEFLIQHRHDNPERQHEYDKRFGLVLRK